MKKSRRRLRVGCPSYTDRAPHRFAQRRARLDTPRGVCRVCGTVVERAARGRIRSWHDGRATAGGEREPNCLRDYKIATRPRFAKAIIARRDGARCRSCSASRGRAYLWLQLDHVRPLCQNGSPGLDNLQLLCGACHAAKTSAEASARAAQRKAAAQCAASA